MPHYCDSPFLAGILPILACNAPANPLVYCPHACACHTLLTRRSVGFPCVQMMELSEIFICSTIKSQIDMTVTTFLLLLRYITHSLCQSIIKLGNCMVMQPNVWLRNHRGIHWATYSLWCLTFNNVHTKPFFLQLHVLAITIDYVFCHVESLLSSLMMYSQCSSPTDGNCFRCSNGLENCKGYGA